MSKFGPLLAFTLCCFINLGLSNASLNYYYEKGIVDTLSPCPGRYCGRTPLANGTWSECGACERGTRRNESSACSPCTDTPSFYDWFYLGFIMLCPLLLHLLCVDLAVTRNEIQRLSWLLYACVVLEVVLASLITLLLSAPMGYLTLVSCSPTSLADWYPLMHNPNPNYEGYLHCTQEAVYPMYSMVLVGYSVLLVLVLLLRPELSRRVARNSELFVVTDAGAVYSALYFLPALTVLHALLAGILYYIFPYLIIVGSIISCATYFAYQLDQSMCQLLLGCVRDGRNVLIILGHWLLLAYGIIALKDPSVHPAHVVLVPLPALFYILTARFSDPSVIPVDGHRPPTPLSRAPMCVLNGT